MPQTHSPLQTPPTLLRANRTSAWNRARHSDAVRFLRSWIESPLRTAAIAPSSQALAHLMTKEIDPSSSLVVELGPGTGVFTQALLRRGIPAQNLALLESNPEFADLLQARFPASRIVCSDVARDRWQLPYGAVPDVIVSGLPLLSMTAQDVSSVLATAFAHLRPGGRLYQFTYAPRCPVRTHVLESLGLHATCIGATLRNLPPAAVFRFEQRSQEVLTTKVLATRR